MKLGNSVSVKIREGGYALKINEPSFRGKPKSKAKAKEAAGTQPVKLQEGKPKSKPAAKPPVFLDPEKIAEVQDLVNARFLDNEWPGKETEKTMDEVNARFLPQRWIL